MVYHRSNGHSYSSLALAHALRLPSNVKDRCSVLTPSVLCPS